MRSHHWCDGALVKLALIFLPPYPTLTDSIPTDFIFFFMAPGWVARICQPWEQSSSKSWLPILEAPI